MFDVCYPILKWRPGSQKCMEHVFSAARAPSSSSFDYYMDKVKLIKPVSYSIMMKNAPSLWANYACRDNVIWDQMTINISESVNNIIRDEVNAWYNSCVFRQHSLACCLKLNTRWK